MERVVLASDFHLTPALPEEIDVFVRFTRDVVRGADRFYVLGDLFETWIGPKNLRVPGLETVFEAFRDLARRGTKVVLFHGNRDFLLGRAEARAAEGSVVGEELPVELFGARYLLMHGDSLCTDDVGYQRSKKWMRCGLLHALSRVMPLAAAQRIAAGMRRASRKSTARKSVTTMGIVADEVRRRFGEGFDALVCGHVHDPGTREYGDAARPMPLHVLGDWHRGGVFGEIDRSGVALRRFDP